MLYYLCLSSHGYGHASRQASILSEVYKLRPDWRFIVSSFVDIDFLNLAFWGLPIEHRRIKWDVGMIQSDALQVNNSSTLNSIHNLEKGMSKQISLEAKWINSQNSEVIIISDIPPSAARLAEELGAKLIWIGNFGWDDIYSPIGGEFENYAKSLSKQYSKGDLLLRCPFSMQMDWQIPEKEVGLTYSKPRKLPPQFHQRLDQSLEPLVMIGFGGLGFRFEYDLLDKWPNYNFIMAKPSNSTYISSCPNLIYLPEAVRVIDVLPFCFRLIGKPGYSTFCEAISQEVGLHIVKRDDFAESEFLIRGLKQYAHYKILEKDDLLSGNWQLDENLIEPLDDVIDKDGALAAAKEIIIHAMK